MKQHLHVFFEALRHPLIGACFAAYSASSLLLSNYMYTRISSILFVPFIVLGIFEFYNKRPPITKHKWAGVLLLLTALLIFANLIEELLFSYDPFIARAIAITLDTCATIVFTLLGLIQTGIIDSKHIPAL